MSAGSVEIVDVTKRFGSTVAVDNVSIEVLPGEFLSLLGPSGCGKTTTLRLLAGFEQPDEGFIRISGDYVQGVPPYRRDVNTVFQHYALFPHMTVAENVAYGLRQKRTSKAEVSRRVGEALEMVKMTKLAKRKPRQMSGGQQQRVALARALVNKPSVLLLDEPLGALDRKLRQEMQIELKLLQNQLGITFVFVTHDQEEALVDVRSHRGHARRAGGAAGRAERDLRAPAVGVRRRIHRPEQLLGRHPERRRSARRGRRHRGRPIRGPEGPCRASPASPPCVPKRSRSPATNRRPGRTSWRARWRASPTSAT